MFFSNNTKEVVLLDLMPRVDLQFIGIFKEGDGSLGSIYWKDSLTLLPIGPYQTVPEAAEGWKTFQDIKEGKVQHLALLPNNVLNLDQHRSKIPPKSW